MFDLKGKVGIITGASSGIGLGTANVLAEAGAKVYGFSRSGHVKVEGVSTHFNVIHKTVDVCDYVALEQSVREIGEIEGIDFLINNAGVTKKCRAEEFSDDDFAWIHWGW